MEDIENVKKDYLEYLKQISKEKRSHALRKKHSRNYKIYKINSLEKKLKAIKDDQDDEDESKLVSERYEDLIRRKIFNRRHDIKKTSYSTLAHKHPNWKIREVVETYVNGLRKIDEKIDKNTSESELVNMLSQAQKLHDTANSYDFSQKLLGLIKLKNNKENILLKANAKYDKLVKKINNLIIDKINSKSSKSKSSKSKSGKSKSKTMKKSK